MTANVFERARTRALPSTGFMLWIALLVSLVVAGGFAALQVFTKGLAVTNLSDLNPWGLWIAIDTSAIALSAGAFSFVAIVYILKYEQFKRLARLAAFVGLSGYSVAMICLLMDLGRPDRFYYGFVFWNTHSPLWEVTMCVGLYFSVMLVENLPNAARFSWLQDRFPKLAAWISKTHDFAPILAIAGLFLSIMHQSSLGNTYGVLVAHPIWYRPGLAVMYFASAVVGGMGLTLFVANIAAYLREEWRVGKEVMSQIAQFVGSLAALLLVLRVVDLILVKISALPGSETGLQLLLSGPYAVNFWAGEIVFGLLVPAVILLVKPLRQSPVYRLSAFFLLVGGLVAFRWDTNMVGLTIINNPVSGQIAYLSYMPSLIEAMAGVGAIAVGILLLTLGMRYLRLMDPA